MKTLKKRYNLLFFMMKSYFNMLDVGSSIWTDALCTSFDLLQ